MSKSTAVNMIRLIVLIIGIPFGWIGDQSDSVD